MLLVVIQLIYGQASIGFSIPIASLFRGPVIWRGLVYTALMTLGKLTCGILLLRCSLFSGLWFDTAPIKKPGQFKTMIIKWLRNHFHTRHVGAAPGQTATSKSKSANASGEPVIKTSPSVGARSARTIKPISLYPASILGWAMVARGEIGFFISSVAESNGIWKQPTGAARDGVHAEDGSDIFITVTWAIFLCTLLGPVMVGIIVRRVKTLEKASTAESRDVMGSWGVH